ncbi:transcriptional regulator with XRE-family HTH domain [Lactobacillus colini]|uniref:Transcriptional regulator with XRE-family HTH domain n=1 Tax=Lactobacillus colini TaxID=1819254 RepID=A0ABS4MH00_9LACO|nr:helix-turn-helix domain-containing protein [Lactobacillus colini]MBP2058976.1 transcriptional regulator with XRE-family HTH domain [Lactobacillus colini]
MVNKIKELRLLQNLSQQQLADKAKISVRTIQRLEAGDDASISTLNLVAEALGVKIADVISDNAKMDDKTKSARELLEYQLTQRTKEFKTFSQLYTAVYIIIMLLWGINFSWIRQDAMQAVLGVGWIGGWLIMEPLKSWLVVKFIDPKLDKNFPLTINQTDKDEHK